jgi:antitoxin component of MazEF toxin-antitoxin module
MKRKIVKVGASLCILLPREVVKTMEWDFGQEIDLILDEEGERVILRNSKNNRENKQTLLDNFENFYKEYGRIIEEIENYKE